MKKLTLLLPLLLLTSCGNKTYTPLEFCYYEVCSDYEEYFQTFDAPYSYKEIYATYDLNSEWYENHNVKSVYNYEITIYAEEKIDVWFCGIAFNSSGKTKYFANECVGIDCDWIYSIELESELKENNNESNFNRNSTKICR